MSAAKAKSQAAAKPAGYSGKSAAEKLGYKPGWRVLVVGKPDTLSVSIAMTGVKTASGGKPPFEAAHIFATAKAVLKAELKRTMGLIARDGMIWVTDVATIVRIRTGERSLAAL